MRRISICLTVRLFHSFIMRMAASMTNAVKTTPPIHTQESDTRKSTAADRMRSFRPSQRSALLCGGSIAPLSAGVFQQRLAQVREGEIRPEHGSKIKFRVGRLPEQEIAEPLLAAGADEQVRVGDAAR